MYETAEITQQLTRAADQAATLLIPAGPFATPVAAWSVAESRRGFAARRYAWIAVVTAVLVVVATLGTLYVRERRDLAGAGRRLTVAQQRLARTRTALTGTRSRLTSAESALSSCRGAVELWRAAFGGMTGIAHEALGRQTMLLDFNARTLEQTAPSMKALAAATGAATDRAITRSLACTGNRI